jgi:hypothetical protein
MKFIEFKTLGIGEYNDKKISLWDTLTNGPIRFQIPRMYMPFGISGFTPQVGPTKWNIDFAMKGYDEDGNYVKVFYEFLKDIEEQIITSVHEQSVDIFGSQYTMETLKSMFNSNIKDASNREPKFRVKVDDKAHFFDSEDNDITKDASDRLFAQSSGAAIVELIGVYFMNKQFGLTWKLNQLKVFEPQRLKGYQFRGPSWADECE